MTQREWIENARRATDARPVRLNKIPRWARHAIQRAYREEGGRSGRYLDMTVVNDERWRGLFDHWGTSQIRCSTYVGPSLVTEPYGGRQPIEMALRFADWIGCDVEIGRASWWYPNYTMRIEFLPRGEDTR